MGYQMLDACFLEDDENDIFIIRRALNASGLQINATFVQKFEQFQELLIGRLQTSQLPGLVFTDLKLTGEDGFTVISWMKEHAILRSIPVMILSSSNVEKDRIRCESLGAAGFITKSCSIRSLAAVFQHTLPPFFNNVENGLSI